MNTLPLHDYLAEQYNRDLSPSRGEMLDLNSSCHAYLLAIWGVVALGPDGTTGSVLALDRRRARRSSPARPDP